MDKPRLELKVGLFVLIGLVLLGTLLIQFSKGGNVLRGSYEVKLDASNVGGLKTHASVLLAGVEVGTVKDIGLIPTGRGVIITLQIYKGVPIYHDARFVIEQSGFLGDQYVAVLPTENELPMLTNNAEIPCQEPFDLQEVARSAAGFIKRMDDTAAKLDASVTDLRSQVLNAQTLSGFGVAVTNMKAFTEQALDAVQNINTLVVTNGEQIGTAVSNLVYFSSELTVLGQSAQLILKTNSVNINDATKNIDDMTANLKQMSVDVQNGKGLAGALLYNEQLATNVEDVAANLSLTTSNLNRHGIWGIMWTHKPPTTNAPSKTKNR